jgi:hypothetical protein
MLSIYSLISLICGPNLKVRISYYSIAISSDIAFLSFLSSVLESSKVMQGFLITLHFVDTLNEQDNFYEIKNSILHIAYMLFVLVSLMA